MYGVYVCVTPMGPAGPEYLRKRLLQDGVEDNEDTDMHEPLLAEEEHLPTPPESPSINELDRLMPGSTPARTPSPSPGIPPQEDPPLLRPGSWSGEKSSKGGGSTASSRANSRTASRPITPSSSTSVLAPASTSAPEAAEAAAPSGCQSSGVEPGSDLEIKQLQKFDGEESPAAPVDPAAPASVGTGLISKDEDQTAQPVVKAPPIAAHKSEPEPAETPGELNPPSAPPSRAASVPRISVEPTRTPSRPGSRSETKPAERREASPAPSPTPTLQAKVVAKAVIGQPVVTPPPTVEPKVEAKPKTVMKVPSKEKTVDSVELEVRLLIFTFNVQFV